MEFDLTSPPAPETVKAAREAAGLTQEQAAALVYRSERKRWSEWESGARQMQLDTFELFLMKAGLK
jgi:transcriptional regulator with XRE-family HTH domain